jgi:hypothetical protein
MTSGNRFPPADSSALSLFFASVHGFAKIAVDSGLITLASALDPCEYVRIDSNRQGFFDRSIKLSYNKLFITSEFRYIRRADLTDSGCSRHPPE